MSYLVRLLVARRIIEWQARLGRLGAYLAASAELKGKSGPQPKKV